MRAGAGGGGSGNAHNPAKPRWGNDGASRSLPHQRGRHCFYICGDVQGEFRETSSRGAVARHSERPGGEPSYTNPSKLRKNTVVTNLRNTLAQLKPSIEKDKQVGSLYRIHPVVTRDTSAVGSVVIALEAARRAANPKSRRDPNEYVNGRLLWTSQEDETGRASEIATMGHLGGLALMPPYVERIGARQPKNIFFMHDTFSSWFESFVCAPTEVLERVGQCLRRNYLRWQAEATRWEVKKTYAFRTSPERFDNFLASALPAHASFLRSVVDIRSGA